MVSLPGANPGTRRGPMMETISFSDLHKRFPLVPRSRIRTDICRGRLLLNPTEHRMGFDKEAVQCWANEWLSAIVDLDSPGHRAMVIHNRDAVILTILQIDGAGGYPRSPRRMTHRRARIRYLRR